MTRTTTTVGGAHRRRRGVAVAGAGVVALLIGFSSVAYACTLLIGTFTVCRPPSSTYVSGNAPGESNPQCVQRVGTGTMTGGVVFDDGGSNISLVGTDFSLPVATTYSLTFAVQGQSCHLFNISAGVTSLLGTFDHDGNALTPQVPNTVDGPDFSVGVGAGSTGGYNTVTTPSASTGSYSICAQDEPERVDGNAVHGQVVLL